jgi:type III restriction enzyme
MEMKRYQERVIGEVGIYLAALRDAQATVPKYAAQEAWRQIKGVDPPTLRRTGAGEDLPTFCIKVPTGGGKTLLATQILGQVYRTLLAARNGAGLVLWVVPSDQIFKDTLKALRERTHFYRESLEQAVSRRIEVWEKHEISRLTPAQMAACLNILIVKLQGTNRQDKESLKFFKDSGGNIVQFFPQEDEPDRHRQLRERISNLDMLEDDAATGRHLAKTSVGNLVRLQNPVVILDEGHKATSKLARETLEGFDPCLIVELSATPPKEANVLCKVSGTELLAEDMIKLPINVANSGQKKWENCITEARDKREGLAAKAMEHYRSGGRLIRPIVLVQVERTGKDQRGPDMIHSEDVKEYLIGRLGVPPECIKIKTSVQDDLEGIDLMAEECRVEWIITKAALQEGWDCPFAYILVSLNNTKSKLSMTQLVGRVLRQPFVAKTPYSELNECYVYCLRQRAEEVTKDVRDALTKEGYEGDAASVVDQSGDSGALNSTRTATMRLEFRTRYRKPFEGRIFLPRFCVKVGSTYEKLDYFRHLLAGVNIAEFDYTKVEHWDLSQDLTATRSQFYRINLNDEALEPIDLQEEMPALLDTDAHTRAWLAANLGMGWYSAKRLRAIVNGVCDRIIGGFDGQLALMRFQLLERIAAFTQEETDLQTEAIFRRLCVSGDVFFYLECMDCIFEIPPTVDRRRVRPLMRGDYSPLQKNLFDFQPDEDNSYEKDVALYLDNHPQVLWWYRNIVGREEFSIQGYKRYRIRPDFVVQQGQEGEARPTVLVVESKGKQLKGSEDTHYKRNVAEYFTEVGRQVTWQELGEGFDKHHFRFQVLDQGDYSDQGWRDELNKMLLASDSKIIDALVSADQAEKLKQETDA